MMLDCISDMHGNLNKTDLPSKRKRLLKFVGNGKETNR
jgi:hypothetical protein